MSRSLSHCSQVAAATAFAEGVVRDPLPFLISAGEQLAASLEYEQTIERLLDIVVPALADMCSIHLLDDDGRFRRIGARHHTAEAAALSEGLTDHYLDSGEQDGPIHRLLVNGTSLLSSPVADAELDLIVGPVRRAQIARQLGITSVMVVPLTARGRPFGVLCMSTSVRPRFERAHLHLAEEVGRRGALALDTARLYRAVSQSQLDAERARRRTAFLAEASATLAASLDIRTTLKTVVQLAVPTMAESCSLALAQEDGTMRRVAVAHANPARQRLIDESSPTIPTNGHATHPMAVVLASGRPLVDNAITDDTRRSYANDEYLDLLRELDIRARLVVPLEARGRRIGTLTLATSDPARTFDGDDVALGVELAGRAALAIDNARLYEDACIANERLAEQLGLSDAIVQNIAEGIMVIDPEGRLTYVNPVAEQLLGRSSSDLLGRVAHEVAHVRDETGTPLPVEECGVRDVFLTGRTARLDDEVFIRADGETFPVALSSSPLLKDGRIVGAVTIFRDVSDRKRHREALRRSEERLRRALTSAGMVMWEHDFATGRTLRSDMASVLYGRPNEELADDPREHARLVHPDDREHFITTQQGAIRAGVGYEVDYRVLWPDGTVRWVSSRASVFRNAHGRPLGLSGTTHDITDRKQAEIDRRRLVRQLMMAQEDERRRLAYEIHDGLAQMASGVQQLVEAYAFDFPSESETARNRMDVTIGLARRTVDEIRRVLAGLRPTVLDDFGLARGLRAFADGLTAENLRVRFDESLGPERLAVDVEIALFRLAQEALTNVRKHTQVHEAELRLWRDGAHVILEVEDHGSGFDLTALKGPDRPGERLGLLSMQERVAQVGGVVEIKSRRGAGTLVRAVVPVFGA
jgi:PAS domain S-box-containing protein